MGVAQFEWESSSGEKWHGEHRGKGESAAHAACVCGPARECGQKAKAEAHIEHVAHVCDAGSVQAQLLVERVRALPSGNEANAAGEVRAGR